MNEQDIDRQLTNLFATVLKLPADEVTDALSPETWAKWDSLSHIHLVNGIEEEFALSLDFDAQMQMKSFGLAKQIVRAAMVDAAR